MKPEFVNDLVELSAGNPGAITALSEMINPLVKADKVDAVEKLINRLQKLKIKGDLLWICYKDICNYEEDLLYRRIISGSIARMLEVHPDRGDWMPPKE